MKWITHSPPHHFLPELSLDLLCAGAQLDLAALRAFCHLVNNGGAKVAVHGLPERFPLAPRMPTENHHRPLNASHGYRKIVPSQPTALHGYLDRGLQACRSCHLKHRRILKQLNHLVVLRLKPDAVVLEDCAFADRCSISNIAHPTVAHHHLPLLATRYLNHSEHDGASTGDPAAPTKAPFSSSPKIDRAVIASG